VNYVVARRRGKFSHEVEPFVGEVEGFSKTHEYVLGPFKREASARAMARFCDGTSKAFDILSKAVKLAQRTGK
jgi:hypothetical protein